VSDFRTVYVSVGNSDNRLAQSEWVDFACSTFAKVQASAREVFGVWWSAPDSPFQNACIAASLHSTEIIPLQAALTLLRRSHRQSSVAWAEAMDVVMI